MGIAGSNTPRSSRGLRVFLRFAIVLVLGAVIAIFVNYRFSSTNVDKPIPPEETKASLSIRNFEHVAMKDGHKQWSLKAASAKMFSDREAELTELEATFYKEGNEAMRLRADHGKLDIASKDLSAAGNVIARHPRFTLKTESLNYRRESHIVEIDNSVEIEGESARVQADGATYDLNTGTIVLDGNVESWINDAFKG